MSEYPKYFVKNKYCWLDDGVKQWKTEFKDYQLTSIKARSRAWHEMIVKESESENYKIISSIILRELNNHPSNP